YKRQLQRRGRAEAGVLVEGLAESHGAGAGVDWEAFFAGSGARRVPLPTYAFQHQRYWLDQLPVADGGSGRALAAAPLPPAAEEPAPAGTVPLSERLADLNEAQREQYVLQTVTTLVAEVLKHPDPSGIAPDRPFQDLGFDSLTAVELRNRLSRATGLALAATVVFDHPNPAALAAHVRDAAAPVTAGSFRAVQDDLDRLEASLTALPDDGGTRAEVTARLRELLERLSGAGAGAARSAAPASGTDVADVAELIASASADDIFDFIDTQLGRAAD
ncbi:phosphopantetheine-binding protein, partial [Streptomyces sp. GC420]|uniref:phosphopantetheine-binding protein n=1 Tax=Streptomyces sp. GC420 TaxID=2697568 RepID=UPI001DBED9B3